LLKGFLNPRKEIDIVVCVAFWDEQLLATPSPNNFLQVADDPSRFC
jgi:hypothetical protein